MFAFAQTWHGKATSLGPPAGCERNMMRTPFILTVLSLAAFSLTACNKTPQRPEVPTVQGDSSAAPASAATSWLPPACGGADAGPEPAAPVATAPPTGERNTAATGSGPESRSMPMAGQNNDHSAPLASEKSASRP